jgi:hypothetical protein
MFNLKQILIYLLTILFVLNSAYGTIWPSIPNCQYQGLESVASDFQCQFFSSDFNVKFVLATPINVSAMDENSVIFSDDKIHFNSTQFNAKSATFTYTNLFTFLYDPIYLRNDVVFTPSVESFDNLTYTSSFTNTINNLENYLISKNSKLSVTPSQEPYFNTTVDFTIAYLNTQTNAPIAGKNCSYLHNSQLNVIPVNTFQIDFNSQIETFSVTCSATSFEEITSPQQFNSLPQPVDNFSVNVSFTQYLGSPTVFANKDLDISITSNGINNLLAKWTTKYFIGLSWNTESIDESTLLYNQWFEIGKNEDIKLTGNVGEEITLTDLFPTKNFSKSLFRNEKDGQNDDKSLILNVKACSTNWLGTQNCKYNHSSYFIFKDLTPPQITKSINGGFLKDNNNIQFDYTVFDYESSVKSLKYAIIENGSLPIEPTNPVVGFNSNIPSTFTATNQNLDNGKYYQFIFKAENGVLVESSNIFSNAFLIDIFNPINSNISLNLNQYGYAFSNSTSIDLVPGNDYAINYSTLNLTESGLNHTRLTMTKHPLLNNNCLNQIENSTDFIYDTTNRTEIFELETGYCYELDYFIFDKADNVNTINPTSQIKIDTTSPTIVGSIDDGSNSQNYGFDESLTIFQTVWTFEDLESGLRDYEVYLLKKTDILPKTLVKTFTNVTNSYIDIKYNSTYIEDGAEYFVQVKATNRANLTTPIYESNGITLFESVAPELKTTNYLFTDQSGNIFDFINDGVTQVDFEDINKLNITCRYYENDVSYDVNQGTACTKTGDNISCNFPSTQNIKFYTYHFSCLNLEQIDNARNKNDETNNFDVTIYHEFNVKPNITQINYDINYSANLSNLLSHTNYNLLENESVTFTITSIDNNVQNIYYTNYTFDNGKSGDDKLNISINLQTGFNPNQFYFKFNNDSNLIVPILQNNPYYLEFYFNGTINKSQLEQVLISAGVEEFSISGLDNATFSKLTTFNSIDTIQSQNLNTSLSTVSNYTHSNILGIANLIEVIKNESFNITQTQILTNTFEFTYTPNTNQRLGQQKTNITFSDGLLTTDIEFIFNVSPIYYAPKINISHQLQVNTTNNNIPFEIGEEQILNLSNYIYEENTQVGLNGILTYQFVNNLTIIGNLSNGSQNYILNNFNPNSPIINITVLKHTPTLNILTTNTNNQSIYLEIGLNTTNYIVPNINVTDENNQNAFNYTNRNTSILQFNFNSSKPLNNATLNINSEYFPICSSCETKTLLLESNDLIIGQNQYTIIFIGKNTLPYTQSGTFEFSFVDQTSIPNIQDSFLSNVPLEIQINNSNNLSNLINNNLNSTQLIKIKNNITNKTLVEFSYNFTLDNLSLVGTKVLYKENSNISTILISNIELQTQSQSRTKTVSIKAPQDTSTYNSVCVRDEELTSINQISNNCNDSNEYVIKCDNTTQNGLTCEHNTNSSQYIISGLRHSGIKVFNSLNFVDPSSGGGSGGSGGGSSGGGSSGGSSGILNYNFETNPTNQSQNQTQISQEIPTEIEINKFDNQKLKLNLSKQFNFKINGFQIIGNFVKSSGKLEFVETLSNSKVFEITTNINSFDLDSDGFKESQIYYTTEGVTFYLNYELLQKPKENITIVPEITVPEKEPKESELEIPEDKDSETKTSNNTLLITILLILICVVFGSTYYFYKKKHGEINIVKINELPTPISQVLITKPSDGYLVNKLKSDHNVLLMKLELEKLNRSGLSWTELYIYLKNEGLSNSQLSYLFTFDSLIKQIKKFCDKNKADFGIQNKIRNEAWITDCFFYERPMEQIVRDIGFMISGVNIYGFKEKTFQDFFIEEMISGSKKEKLSQNQKDYLDKEIKQKLFQFE